MTAPFSLTEEQRDILTETINIGFGRAAASLSILVSQKVLLEVPRISSLSVSDLSQALSSAYANLAAVQQGFMGGFQGDVILIMDLEIAARFIDLLSGGPGHSRQLTASDREALMEIGNILLNAYIGSFGNLLNTQINFTTPTLHMHSLNSALSTIESSGPDHSVLLVETKFLLNNGAVAGHVALIIEASSLEFLFQTIQSAGLAD
jgi:chemotaxis protein CheC